MPNEHPDNDRFASDCERWFDHPVTNIRSEEFSDCWDVWQSRRYLAGHQGAPCTVEMKKAPRQLWEREWFPDVEVFGFTVDEQPRLARFRSFNPELVVDAPLVRAGLSASDCAALVARAGIARPEMYRLGFRHNNCRTCVKASSPGYWAKVRQHFPEDFARMAALSRELGWSPCRNSKGAPIWLDRLPANTPCVDDSPGVDCSLLCYLEEQLQASAA